MLFWLLVIENDFQLNSIISGRVYYLSIMLTPSVLLLSFAGINFFGDWKKKFLDSEYLFANVD